MKITIKEANKFISNYNSCYKSLKLPLTTAFDLTKIYKQVTEIREFYNNKILELLKDYAVQREDGSYIDQDGNFQFKEDKVEEGRKAFQEADTFETEVDDIKIDTKKLLDVEMTAEELEGLYPWIEEPTE